MKLNKLKIGIVAAAVLTVAGAGYYLTRPQTLLREYDASRDKAFVLGLFDKDWYWLSGYAREDVNTDMFLEQRTPSLDPQYAGKLAIKVLYVGKEPQGFVAYYPKSFYEGVILFLDVAEFARRKHYGEMLLNAAIGDMFKQGASVVRLVTRPQNIPAQNLYKKLGFVEYDRNPTYVYFEKKRY